MRTIILTCLTCVLLTFSGSGYAAVIPSDGNPAPSNLLLTASHQTGIAYSTLFQQWQTGALVIRELDETHFQLTNRTPIARNGEIDAQITIDVIIEVFAENKGIKQQTVTFKGIDLR